MTPSSMLEKLAHLLDRLSYSSSNGWVAADDFETAGTHRFAFAQAREQMHIVGAFCWLSHSHKQRSVNTPLVYVATATNRAEAQEIHRKVWSQGLVPFLVIATLDEVILCDGFRYMRQNWDKNVKAYGWEDIPNIHVDSSSNQARMGLAQLSATRLRSSLFWRDYAIDVTGRVDQRLLEGLDGLSRNLINGLGVSKKLGYKAANGLIGKLLYVFFLADRGVINQKWLDQRGHGQILLSDETSSWPKQSLWKLLADLDEIFNGSIFPLSPSDRAQIDHTHIDLVRRIMKHGATIVESGTLQLALFDIDLGVLRVETLSAVYEQFLENVMTGERRRVGAYYTPPFLVDLVLNQLEDVRQIEDGTTILDPAAGSGVFLVGAYRRILERQRTTALEPMSLDTVRGLLTRNIFGVERNVDACNVSAFSLYLTMLDYVNPRDLTRVAKGEDPKKLFPSLVNHNLFPQDFFARSISSKIPKVTFAVGNPPWQALKKLGSTYATKWLERHPGSPVGNDQAAELFVWKALREHLAENGVIAMLIPTKSFVNPTSARFRDTLANTFSILGAINLSHLRHNLFVEAKHACAGLFLQNRPPQPDERTWIYSPLSASQPLVSRQEAPWTLVMDRADVQVFHQEYFITHSRAWLEALVLRPVDRQIHRYVEDQARIKRISLLGTLCKSIGARLKRGGNSSETGLSAKELDDDFINGDDRDNKSGRTLDLFEDIPAIRKPNRLSVTQLSKVKPQYKNQFSGNILLVPRNFQEIRYVDYPKGYTSSFLAVFFDKPSHKVTEREKRFLLALEKYLNSRTAMYFVATVGRRWLIDRRNLEPSDFADLPVPITSLDDDRIEKIIALQGKQLDEYLLRIIGISGDLKNSVEEFLDFRIGFQDGNVPSGALKAPTKSTITKYSKVLRSCLDGLVGRKGAFNVTFKAEPKIGIGVVAAHFSDLPETTPENMDMLCEQAIRKYERQDTNSFSDSLNLDYVSGVGVVFATKPLEYFRWTVDSAYTDSRQVMGAFSRRAD